MWGSWCGRLGSRRPRRWFKRDHRAYTRPVIIHRRRPITSITLLLIALLMLPFALVGGPLALAVAVVVWAGVIALLVRRYRNRRTSNNPPPWVV